MAVTAYSSITRFRCSKVADVNDWIEQCFTSPPTQYRLYGRRLLQVKRTNQQYQSTEGDATKDKEKNSDSTVREIRHCTLRYTRLF